MYRHLNYHFRRASNNSDASISEKIFKYFCYKSIKYFIADYKFQEANKEFARNLRLNKKGRYSRKLIKDSKEKPFKDKKKKSCCLRNNKKSFRQYKKYKYIIIYLSDIKDISDYNST